MERDSVPVVTGARFPSAPENVWTEIACDGAAVFGAGFQRGSKVPVVWTGEVDAAGGVTWSGKAAALAGYEADYLALAAEPGAGGKRFAISGHDEFSLCTGVFVFERRGDRWAETGHLTQPDGERDILFGTPIVLRGGEVFTLDLPGGDLPGPAMHRFRRQATSWGRAAVPFAPGVTSLEWQLALSRRGDSLAVTTQRQGGQHFVDLHVAAAGRDFGYVASIALPGASGAMEWAEERLAVGLSPAAEGTGMLFVEKGPRGFEIAGRLAFPGGGAVSAMAVPAEDGPRLLVSTGADLWLVDAAKRAVTHRLQGPAEGPGQLGWTSVAMCRDVAFALAGEFLFAFRLPAAP